MQSHPSHETTPTKSGSGRDKYNNNNNNNSNSGGRGGKGKMNKKNLRVAIPENKSTKDIVQLNRTPAQPETPSKNTIHAPSHDPSVENMLQISTPSGGLGFYYGHTSLTPTLDTPSNQTFSGWLNPGWSSPQSARIGGSFGPVLSPMTPDSGNSSAGSAGRTPTQLTPSMESSMNFVNSALIHTPTSGGKSPIGGGFSSGGNSPHKKRKAGSHEHDSNAMPTLDDDGSPLGIPYGGMKDPSHHDGVEHLRKKPSPPGTPPHAGGM